MPRRSELFTEDPFYLPRYCGYLPQFKYRIGKTYGRHSVEILTDDTVAKSGKYVLTPTDADPANVAPDGRVSRLKARSASFGNQNLRAEMVPGYTGYIPKREHYFARTYGDLCKSAIDMHETEQGRFAQKQASLKKTMALQTGKIRPTTNEEKRSLTANHITPLPPKGKDLLHYKSPQEFVPYGNSYSMDDSNKMKWFKSGYTGFVPRTRELISLGYPVQSNRGLVQFTADQKLVHELASKPSIPPLQRPSRGGGPPKTRIYPSDIGMVPHYTGYIPGYKYQIGHTYGQHTINTLKLPATART